MFFVQAPACYISPIINSSGPDALFFFIVWSASSNSDFRMFVFVFESKAPSISFSTSESEFSSPYNFSAYSFHIFAIAISSISKISFLSFLCVHCDFFSLKYQLMSLLALSCWLYFIILSISSQFFSIYTSLDFFASRFILFLNVLYCLLLSSSVLFLSNFLLSISWTIFQDIKV